MSERNKIEQMKAFVEKQIRMLLNCRETSGGKAMLANLRRGIGKKPGEIPELWGIILNELPEELYHNSGEPSVGEWAVYLSLTMFALHQQGSAEPVHCAGDSLGCVAAKLDEDHDDEGKERVLRRFGPLVTAKDMPELANHLRGMVQLFKAKGIPLDYVKLAEDLYYFQKPDEKKKVQLRWGQDFYCINKGE